ncbi:uncharacterized protein LOC133731550 [Rosa rugosa]|uniref:uncharacterized protein LOC133731550 n=1 Tax=Rosa rugosa TaxID=74645 RepID=UPI002B40C8D4|nr:uncharacterized protein LOC133731550 [Rosa rugosa]XP_062014901.1 uncharacterized protein LOC133731550 [Rosa rugosa]XP_062014902.1 uncharacterized protein LOC133731550 [Rosa rugosa]
MKLRVHHSDYPIKSIRLDNTGEFTSKSFDDYCISLGIDAEHIVPYVHTQDGLANRILVMRTKLLIFAWGYAILHAAMLVPLRPTATQPYSTLQLVTGYEPDVSHLLAFGYAVRVPIVPSQRTKLGPQRRMGIYVGYESPSIIRFLEPLTGDLFTARFADCHFDETVFPPLGGDKNVTVPDERRELTWNVPTMSHLNPRTAQCDNEVRRILDLQSVAQNMPDAFSDLAKVTRSHIPAANVPARIDVPVGRVVPDGRGTTMAANQSHIPAQKLDRPLGSKDSYPQKRVNSAQMNLLDIAISN